MSKYRSNLFIPGHTLDRLEKAQGSNADAIIVDLEDGCPDSEKLAARETLINLLKENAFSKPLFVRVNDAMEALGREDIDSISPFQDQIEAIILPKTQSFDLSLIHI